MGRTSAKLLLALGNPGVAYRDTRHNAGWWLADHLVRRWDFPPFRVEGRVALSRGSFGGGAVVVAKPMVFMNRSGQVLPRLLHEAGVEPEKDLMVLVDDASLPPGRFRLRARGSAGGHNGLDSIESALGSREYGRFRIGVGSPPDPEVDLAAWVLAAPGDAEEQALLECFGRMAEAVDRWLAAGIETAMNEFN